MSDSYTHTLAKGGRIRFTEVIHNIFPFNSNNFQNMLIISHDRNANTNKDIDTTSTKF